MLCMSFHYFDERQALAVQGERRRKMVEETFFNYAEARSTQGTIAATFSKEKRKLTIDSKELSLLLEDILQESLAETPIENEDAMKLREMRPLFKRLIREEVVPIIFKQVDSNTNGVINFVEFCEGICLLQCFVTAIMLPFCQHQ